MSSFSTTHPSIPGEGKLQNYTLQQAILRLQLLYSTPPSSSPPPPPTPPLPGPEWPYHLAPFGSSLPFFFMSPASYSAQTLGLSLHTLSSQDPPCCHTSSFPFIQASPNCVNPITRCPHSGQNHPTAQAGASTVWWSVPVVGCALAIQFLAAAEASRFLLKAMLTSLLCSVLYPKLTPCSEFIPSPSLQFSSSDTDQIPLQIPPATHKCFCEKQRRKWYRMTWIH